MHLLSVQLQNHRLNNLSRPCLSVTVTCKTSIKLYPPFSRKPPANELWVNAVERLWSSWRSSLPEKLRKLDTGAWEVPSSTASRLVKVAVMPLLVWGCTQDFCRSNCFGRRWTLSTVLGTTNNFSKCGPATLLLNCHYLQGSICSTIQILACSCFWSELDSALRNNGET